MTIEAAIGEFEHSTVTAGAVATLLGTDGMGSPVPAPGRASLMVGDG